MEPQVQETAQRGKNRSRKKEPPKRKRVRHPISNLQKKLYRAANSPFQKNRQVRLEQDQSPPRVQAKDSKGKEKRTGRFEGRRAIKKGDGAETEIRTDQRELKEVINKGQTAEEEKLHKEV